MKKIMVLIGILAMFVLVVMASGCTSNNNTTPATTYQNTSPPAQTAPATNTKTKVSGTPEDVCPSCGQVGTFFKTTDSGDGTSYECTSENAIFIAYPADGVKTFLTQANYDSSGTSKMRTFKWTPE